MNRFNYYKLVLKFIFILYCPAFIYIVFFLRRRRAINSRLFYLIPFKNKWIFLTTYWHRLDYNEWKSFISDVAGNILLFIPFTFFLVLLANIKDNKTLLFSAAVTSILIETIQFIFAIGVADIDDVILNLSGAAIGAAIAKKMQPRLAYC